MIRFSNNSVFEQFSRTNCVRKPRFDCIYFTASGKQLQHLRRNVKKQNKFNIKTAKEIDFVILFLCPITINQVYAIHNRQGL